MENSFHYLGESLNHVMQFQQNVNRNMVRTLKFDRQKSITPRTSIGATGGEYPTKGI